MQIMNTGVGTTITCVDAQSRMSGPGKAANVHINEKRGGFSHRVSSMPVPCLGMYCTCRKKTEKLARKE